MNEQPEFPDFMQLRDEGMARVLAKAQRIDATFTDRATAHIIELLSTQRDGLTGEQIVNACKHNGITPHNDRAFGPIFHALAKNGILRKAGFRKRTKGHGADGAVVWRLV